GAGHVLLSREDEERHRRHPDEHESEDPQQHVPADAAQALSQLEPGDGPDVRDAHAPASPARSDVSDAADESDAATCGGSASPRLMKVCSSLLCAGANSATASPAPTTRPSAVAASASPGKDSRSAPRSA